LTGVGVGWIVLPLLVVADDWARALGDTHSIAPVLADGIVGGAMGLLIGAWRLGPPGLIGAIGGAIGGAALPYLAIPPMLGVTAWGVGVYGEYLPGIVAAAVAAGIGMALGARSRVPFRIRPVATVVAGLVVLALWFGFWVMWAQAARQM